MKYDDDIIANMDETPININMPLNYKITKKKEKKLDPLVIFKGKNNNSKIIEELNNNFYIKEKKIFFALNKNAWCNSEIMDLWNKLILRKYLDSLGDIEPSLLILDKAFMHKISSVIKNKEQYDTKIKFIPSGMTSILQHLGVVINKKFKDLLRKKYIQYSISINCDNAKVSYSKIIDWIADIWWNNDQINSTLIKSSFRIIGLANKLDKSEGYLFKEFKTLREEIVLGKDKVLFNNEVSDLSEDDYF